MAAAVRAGVAGEEVAPAPVDTEVANALRARVRLGQISAADGRRLLDTYRWMAVTRHNVLAMCDRIWELRDKVTAYDAAYVALAEAIECSLVTADARLGQVRGLCCPVTVVPG